MTSAEFVKFVTQNSIGDDIMKFAIALMGIFFSCHSFAGYEGQMDNSGLFITKIECEVKWDYKTRSDFYDGYFVVDYGSINRDSILSDIPERTLPYQFLYFPLPFLPSAKDLKDYINRHHGSTLGEQWLGNMGSPGFQLKEWACLYLDGEAYIVFRGNGWSGTYIDLDKEEHKRGNIDLETNLVFVSYVIKEKPLFFPKLVSGCENFDCCIFSWPEKFPLRRFFLDLEEHGLRTLKKVKYKKEVEIYNSIIWHPINRFPRSATDAEFEKFQDSIESRQ